MHLYPNSKYALQGNRRRDPQIPKLYTSSSGDFDSAMFAKEEETPTFSAEGRDFKLFVSLKLRSKYRNSVDIFNML